MTSPAFPFTVGTEQWTRLGWIPLRDYPAAGPEPQGELHLEPVAAFRALPAVGMLLSVGPLAAGVSVDVVLRAPGLAPRAIPLPTADLGGPLNLVRAG